MDYASLMNSAGNFVEPYLNSTEAAAQAAIIMNNANSSSSSTGAGAVTLSSGDQSLTNVSLFNAQGPDSYPIASSSYFLL
jgi:hypothetical protein